MSSNLFRKSIVEYWLKNVWLDANGQPCPEGTPGARFVESKRVKPGTTGAKKVKRRSAKWHGRVPGRKGLVSLSANKVAAQQMLAELVRKAELAEVGIVDRFEDHKKRPLADHLDDYRRFLEAEGSGKEHVAKTVARITSIMDGCEFRLTNDITPEKVTEFLHGLRRDPRRPVLPVGLDSFTGEQLEQALGGTRPFKLGRILRREGLQATGTGKARRYPRETVEALQGILLRGIGTTTSNGYLTAMKGFTRWLADKDRIDRDRLKSLSRLDANGDIRHGRRELLEGEMQALLVAAGTSPTAYLGLTGPDRQMLYVVAMTTGYRASELATLTPRSFDLNAATPTATVRAGYTKNGEEAVQPLPSVLVVVLRAFLAGRDERQALWPGEWPKDAAEMIRRDLEAAGIVYRDADGLVADFHAATRHSYVSLLARSGVHPKLAQELARHSDIRLTMQTYTHTRLHDLADAVEGLPSLFPTTTGSEQGKQVMRATGTDSVCAPVGRGWVQSSDGVCAHMIARDGTGEAMSVGESDLKSLTLMRDEEACKDMMQAEEKLPGLDSNQDKESQNLFVPQRNQPQTLALRASGKPVGAPVGTDYEKLVPEEADLARLVEAWPTLSAKVRQRIMGLVDRR